jgi:GlpG protein
MRLIGSFSNATSAIRITTYLKQKGIENKCEMASEPENGQLLYQLWILDEDKVEEATVDFERFQKEPLAPEFDTPMGVETPPLEEVKEEELFREEVTSGGFAAKKAPLTVFLLTVCCVIFLLNAVQELPMRQEGLSNVFLMTPIQAALLYDLPPPLGALEEMIEKKVLVPGQKIENLAPEVQLKLQEIEKMPYWRGIYDWFLLKGEREDASLAVGPMFSQIRGGEFWRLFSPCILHSEFLHILFNMIWLWVLGRPIEQRIGMVKTGLLTVFAGIGSNTCQYLMSGPFFIGYSGIVMALAGFIWVREKVAPWEGYPLNRTTVFFLLLFIGSMFLLTFFSFFLHLFAHVSFAPNIANTAHIVGAGIGAFLGKFPFFSQRAEK